MQDTEDYPVVLTSGATSALSLALHPLPILNISEHFTRLKLQTNSNTPFVLGALLGTQSGRDVEIVNSFELALDDENASQVDHGFFASRKDQYKQVFPSLDVIGWYTVATEPTHAHVALHEQFLAYTPTPVLLLLQPTTSTSSESEDASGSASSSITGEALPVKAYEPTVEIRDRKSRRLFIEAKYAIHTGEAERIAVDWTAKGGEGGTSLESHLQTQRAAVKMLYDRIQILVQYVSDVVAGKAPIDHDAIRAINALMGSLSGDGLPEFREEFNQEYDAVQLTACLSSWTQSTNALNDLVDKHVLLSAVSREEGGGGGRGGIGGLRRMRWGAGGGGSHLSDWERFH